MQRDACGGHATTADASRSIDVTYSTVVGYPVSKVPSGFYMDVCTLREDSLARWVVALLGKCCGSIAPSSVLPIATCVNVRSSHPSYSAFDEKRER